MPSRNRFSQHRQSSILQRFSKQSSPTPRQWWANNSVFEYYFDNIQITSYSYLYSATILDQIIFPLTCHFQQPNIIPIRIWLNIVSKISFVFAFGHFRKMNAICISIQPKIWIRIIFVLVFSSENTISLPLPQQMVPSPLDCKANNICTHIHIRIHIYGLTYVH